MFDLFFSHSGRINRKVFIWSWFYLIFIELGITYFVEHPAGSFLVMLPGMYCMAVLSVKRFHDLDKSGWFYLTLWIPIVSIYFYALLVFKKGIIGNNTYGPDPLEDQKKTDTPVEPAVKPATKQYSIGSQKDIVPSSANSNPVSTSSPGFGKNMIVRLGVVLIVAAIIGYIFNSNPNSHEQTQQTLLKKTPESDRGLSSSTAENSELEENPLDDSPPSKFVFKVLNVNNDEVTVQFERDIPMNIKFFGISKDLVRRAEILSRADQRQAVIFLNSASLLQIGKRYYGYLVNPSEEPAPSSEDWL